LVLTQRSLADGFLLFVQLQSGLGFAMWRLWGLLVLASWFAFAASPSVRGEPAIAEAQKSRPGGKAARTDQYGDLLPPGAVARLGTARFRNGGTGFHLSASGKVLALYGDNRASICLCDAATGALVHTLWGKHEDEAIKLLDFSPDGRKIATLMGLRPVPKQLALWDVATGKQCWRMSGPGETLAAVFTPDGKHVVTGTDGGTVGRWEVATGRLLRTFQIPAGRGDEWSISPDGRRCAARVGPEIRLWEVVNGKELRKFEPRQLLSGPLVFSAHGKFLASPSRDGSSIHVCEVATGKGLRIPLPRKPASAGLTFSPDDRTVVAVLGKGGEELYTVCGWDTATGARRLTLPVNSKRDDCRPIHPIGAKQLAFSPDGRRLAVAAARFVTLWNVPAGQRLWQWPAHQPEESPMAFSSDGTLLIAQDGQALRFWDVASGAELPRPVGHTDQACFLAFTDDGQRLASGGLDGSVRLWDVATGRQFRGFQGPAGRVAGLACAPDGTALASCDDTGDIRFRLWDVASGRQRWRFERDAAPGNLGGAPPYARLAFVDAKILAVLTSDDGSLSLRDAATGREQAHLGRGPFSGFAFSSDGKVLAACGNRSSTVGDEALELLEVPTGRLLRSSKTPQRAYTNLAFSRDGKVLATQDGAEVHVWEVTTLQKVHQATVRADRFVALTVTPEGNVLAVEEIHSDHKQIDVWDVVSGKKLRRFLSDGTGFGACALSPDGTKLATASQGTPIVVWDLQGLGTGTATPAPHLAPRDLDRLWEQLAGDDPASAYRAVRALCQAPDQAVAFLQGLLRPGSPENQARLIGDLDSEQFAVRDAATKELARLGHSAGPKLRAALRDKPTLEKRRRIEALLAPLETHAPRPELLRQSRAVQALEQIGSRQARELLGALATGSPEAWLTQEAKASLRRLAKRPVSPP
jgi:WD40 repeat protein